MFKVCVLLLLLIFGYLNSDPISFEDCGSEYYIEEVDIQGCKDLPCCLIIGTQQKIKMKLYAKTQSKKLVQDVYLILKGIHSGLDVTPEDPCSQIACPVNYSYDVSFSALMNINSTLVPLKGELHWIIKNEANTQVLCMKTEIGLQYLNDGLDGCKNISSSRIV